MSDVTLDDIVSLAKRRGFIFQGSDIYGGLAGTWDYGPLGLVLKKNIMNLWWKMFVAERDDMLGVDAAILMNPKVWQASGHTEGFTDPLVEDIKTLKTYRADTILKEAGIDVKGLGLAELQTAIDEHQIKSPDGNELGKVEMFNMMFKTIMGPVYRSIEGKKTIFLSGEIKMHNSDGSTGLYTISDKDKQLSGFSIYDRNSITYLRPETAQGIFTNYKNVIDTFYPDVPFGIAQQGKAFRNEISPRDFVFRAREFEQMEIEYFVHPEKWEDAFEQWRQAVWQWTHALGLPDEKVHEEEVPEADRAHYSKRTIDFNFDFPHGSDELLGLAYRTDFDLMNIQKATGKSMEYRPKDGSALFVPHVIEPSFGVERAIMAVLTSAFAEDEQNGEKRTFLKLPVHLAPVKVAVSPLLKNKPELVEKAREVYATLKKEFGAVMWDDNGNIGKRYRRQDEIGTPFCVTIDFQTLDDSTVTVRNRDTTEQERVETNELKSKLKT
jgi:glycyl-tRNA synthetase